MNGSRKKHVRVSRRKEGGWLADWWERDPLGRQRHRQVKRQTQEEVLEVKAAKEEEWRDMEAARAAEARIERAAAKRGDNVVILAALAPEAKMACAAALEVLKKAGVEARELVDAASEWVRRQHPGGLLTTGELVAKHLEWIRQARRPATAADRRKQLKTFVEEFGETKSSLIGPPEVRGWVEAGGSQSVQAARKRAVSALYGWAKMRGLARTNPAQEVQVEKPPRGDVAIFRAEEVERILRAAEEVDARIVPYYAFGFFCGLRPTRELRGLREEHVDLEQKVVLVRRTTSKTDRGRYVPMTDNLVEWCRKYPVKGGIWWRKRVHLAVVKAAGVKWLQDGMRHTRASFRVAAGVPLATVAAEDGHSIGVLLASYTNRIIKPDEVRRFWGIVPMGGDDETTKRRND